MFFDELVGPILVSRMYFGVTNLGLSLRLISSHSFNPLPKILLF